MNVRAMLRSQAHALLARAFRAWEQLKRSHPAVAELLLPVLRRLWLWTIERRPGLAALRERSSDPLRGSQREPVITFSARVADEHVIRESEHLVAARIEHAFAVPDLGVFLAGWLFDPKERITNVTVRAGHASSENVLPAMSRRMRSDVSEAYRSWAWDAGRRKHGFVCLARLPGASVVDVTSGLSIEFGDADGHTWHLRPRPVIHEPDRSLATIRDIFAIAPPRDPDVLRDHVGATVAALWKPKEGSSTVIDLGPQLADPRVSIVVPIYGRYDFIEHQLALFSGDPDMTETEIIYVIDDPLIGDDATRLCREIQPIFEVSSRVVLCDRNNGFARATNIGARLARGQLLMLLNSDVMPATHGWLSGLLDVYADLPSPGVVGPRLLFPDRSLQHDGMAFVQAPWFPGIWLNDHPGKGLPPPAVVSRTARRVPAITAAAMLISRQLYEQVGGLDEGYIIGDFEDSDLCLKLAERGHGSYIAPWIELFHLERQSQGLDGDTQWRQWLTLYNAWRHTQRWEPVLADGRAGAWHG